MIKFLKLFTESLAWLQIAASPTLIGAVIGLVIYLARPGAPTLIAGLMVALAGLITGIVWATRVWKSQGTVWFVSRVNASPDFNLPKEPKSEEEASAK